MRTECLAYALDQRIEFGVWGGMTERERRALLRQRPDVLSWADVLDYARTRHDASLPPAETLSQDVLSSLTELAVPRLHRTA